MNKILENLNIIFENYMINKSNETTTKINKKLNSNLKKIIIPPEIKIFSRKINVSGLSCEIKPFIKEFVKKINSNFNNEDLHYFYHNINSLKIVNKNSIIANKRKLEGQYVYDKNTIYIYNNNISITIFHELLHMASSIKKDGRYFIGFHQYSLIPGDDFGKGLNEGYTELLTKRYFGNDNQNRYGYDFEIFLAYYLEDIVGKDNMSSNYFKANLKGLINDLSKYESNQNIMFFIKCLDYYNLNCSDMKNREKIYYCIDYCIGFIFNISLNKLRMKYDNNLISRVDLINELNNLYGNLCFKFENTGELFELTYESYLDDINKIFGDILSPNELNK